MCGPKENRDEDTKDGVAAGRPIFFQTEEGSFDVRESLLLGGCPENPLLLQGLKIPSDLKIKEVLNCLPSFRRVRFNIT